MTMNKSKVDFGLNDSLCYEGVHSTLDIDLPIR